MGVIRDIRAANGAGYDPYEPECADPMQDARETVDHAISQLEKFKDVYHHLVDYVDQGLGKALHYPEYFPVLSREPDGGVCTGDMVPEVLVDQAANTIKALERQHSQMRLLVLGMVRNLGLYVRDEIVIDENIADYYLEYSAHIGNAARGRFPQIDEYQAEPLPEGWDG